MKDDPDPMVGSGTVDDRAERLTRTIRDQSSPNLRPRDSATLILIDRSGTVPKVLLGRRHERHRFLPGKFVFPGGRVEIKDRLMPTAAPLHARDTERLMQRVKRPSLAKAAAYALAAIRETYEETGLMLGAPSPNAFPAPAEAWEPFAKAGIVPDLSAVHFIGRAITPPGRPRRFDSRFFAADFNGGRAPRRGLCRRRLGIGRSGLDANRRRAPARYPRHHRHRPGRAAGPDRNRHEP